MKKRAVVVCPGRGTYTKETLGYLKNFGPHVSDFIHDLDERRRSLDEPSISALDGAEVFKPQVHTKGEHASSLIYACSYADFMAIDRDQYEIVAITGNSMGWYLTLAFGGALDWGGGFQVVNTMGSMMKEEVIGGQVLYPLVDSEWKLDPAKVDLCHRVAEEISSRPGHEVYTSIFLGGFVVFGANRAGVQALLKELPATENYPFQLINHAAFHTPLLAETSERAFRLLPESLFHRPEIPLIDGRGCIWQPYSTSISALFEYTLGHQVYAAYDFSAAVTVALKEFCPDHVILLGPGHNLGGSIGQILIQNEWLNVKSKADFTQLQTENPFVLAMGRPEQRKMVVK